MPPSRGGLCDGVMTMPSARSVARPALYPRMACETTGVGVNVPWLVTAPPRGGAAPSIDVAFDPLGLVAVTLLGAALFTAVGALRTRVARA